MCFLLERILDAVRFAKMYAFLEKTTSGIAHR